MTAWNHGDRVTHNRWGSTGTVHTNSAAQPDEASAEVRWDGTCVADDLDLVANDLNPA